MVSPCGNNSARSLLRGEGGLDKIFYPAASETWNDSVILVIHCLRYCWAVSQWRRNFAVYCTPSKITSKNNKILEIKEEDCKWSFIVSLHLLFFSLSLEKFLVDPKHLSAASPPFIHHVVLKSNSILSRNSHSCVLPLHLSGSSSSGCIKAFGLEGHVQGQTFNRVRYAMIVGYPVCEDWAVFLACLLVNNHGHPLQCFSFLSTPCYNRLFSDILSFYRSTRWLCGKSDVDSHGMSWM